MLEEYYSKTLSNYCDGTSWNRQGIYVILCSISLFLSFIISILIMLVGSFNTLALFIKDIMKIDDPLIGVLFPITIQILLVAGVIFIILNYVVINPICKSKFRKEI